MAASGDRHGSPIRQVKDLIGRLPAWIRDVADSELGEELVEIRESIVQLEAAFADGLRRFDKSGEYRADGAVSLIDWLRWKAKLSGGAAMERVTIARQLEQLPQTRQAFASGDVGYQHVALLARTAEKVGATAVQGEETNLLKAAESMDPGRFSEVAKTFEYRVDHAAALTEANRGYARRYLHISDVKDGLVHLEGLLDAEGAATLKTALGALMPPPKKDDERTPGQRRADAMVELARRPLDGSKLGSIGGQRPHLVITASAETLAGIPGAPPAHPEGSGAIPIETAQRHACDPSVSWLLGQAELESETSHAPSADPRAHSSRACGSRSRLWGQPLQPAAGLVRWAPCGVVDPRGKDGARQPGPGVRAPSPHAARGGLDARTKRRPLVGQATRWAGSGECLGCQSPAAASLAGLAKRSLAGGLRLGEGRCVGLVDQPQKAFDKRGVPLLAFALPEGADHFLARPPSAVGAIVAHRHEGIGNGNDSGEQRNVLAIQPVRIAGPVDPFVMVSDRRQDLLGARQGGEDFFAHDRMALHLAEFTGVQTALL